jgi:hydrogenase 3 maturation protease
MVEKELESWLSDSERVVVVGIGNPIRTDDFVGVKIAQDLQGKVSEKVCLLESETVPESFVQQIVDFKPTHVLLIDAAVLGLKPGELSLVEPRELTSFPAYSTHVLPLRIFCEYIGKMTGAKIAMLLVEPVSTDFGEGISAIIQDTEEKIVSILVRLLPR